MARRSLPCSCCYCRYSFALAHGSLYSALTKCRRVAPCCRSRGETWVQPRELSSVLPGGVTQIVAALGGALQLSSTNKYHPNRMVWNGVGAQGNITNRAIAWFSDDGGKTFQFARDATTGSIFLPEGIGEESALAETPDGDIFLSSRNFLFHGKGKCDCRASVRFSKGGDTFGEIFPSPDLVEPECEATMLGPVNNSAAAMFHANPGTLPAPMDVCSWVLPT